MKYAENGKRLREFAKNNFASMVEFSRELGIKPQTLDSYLSGRRRPGDKMEGRLKNLGCDVHWLRYGVSEEERDLKIDAMFLRKVREKFPEKFEMLDMLAKNGINTSEELEELFDKIKSIERLFVKQNK